MPQEVGPGRVFELLQGRGLDLAYAVAGHAERCRDGVREFPAPPVMPKRIAMIPASGSSSVPSTARTGFQLPVEDNFGGFVFRRVQQLFGPGFSSAPAVEHLGVQE